MAIYVHAKSWQAFFMAELRKRPKTARMAKKAMKATVAAFSSTMRSWNGLDLVLVVLID